MNEFVRVYNKDTEGQKKIAKNFRVAEFSCENESVVLIDSRLVDALQQFRAKVRRAVNITSGYRDRAQNEAAGGSVNSAHLYGAAADFYVEGMDGREAARILAEMFPLSCIGYYENTGHVHFQLAATSQRYVNYGDSSEWVKGF